MKLFCFGKYGPYPKAGHACSCYMLNSQGRNIIIDLGCGALSKVLNRLRLQDIDAIVLSHLHADHMGDMLTLRYALSAARKMGKRSDPLSVYMPNQPIAEALLITSNEMINPVYISDNSICSICGIEVSFALMPHAVPSYAMAFRTQGKTFVYSGDTKDNDRLASFAKDADLFLMEAALLSTHKTPDALHVSAVDAGRIGKEAGAKRLLITHIFPEYDENAVLHEAKQHYPGVELIEEQKIYEV
ncbi:MAG: MBL fold metallo-hydrolase [Christensenellales bacterium]|jgi:ribonuclease BN (tRNA processing enzyme)